MAKNTNKHYVDNVKFYEEMSAWKIKVIEADLNNAPHPQMSNYIGQCILDIATRFSYSHKFVGYITRDLMISSAVEICIRYAYGFDHLKYNNPHAYFTMYCYRDFLKSIRKEKVQLYAKARLVQFSGVAPSLDWEDAGANEYEDQITSLYDVNLTELATSIFKRKSKVDDSDDGEIPESTIEKLMNGTLEFE